MIEIVVAAFAVMLVSLVGVVATWKILGNWMTRYLHYLISFSAGVFLVIALGLSREVLAHATVAGTLTLIGFGILSFFVLSRIAFGTHEHPDPSEHGHQHSKREGYRIMAADALHNITDGIILVPAFAVSTALGIIVTVGIVVHELVQEISEFFVLRDAGYSIKEALTRNFLVSATILIGVAVGMLLTQVEGIELGLLGLAAGGFLYVVFADLVPHSLKTCTNKYCTMFHLLWALAGVVIMLGVNVVTADVHQPEEAPHTDTFLVRDK